MTICHFIEGKHFLGNDTRTQSVFNPATGEVTGHVSVACESEINRAVESAKRAFASCSEIPPIRRARVMNRCLKILNGHKKDTVREITLKHWENFSDAVGEVERDIDIVEFACGIPHLLKVDYTDQVFTGRDNWTMQQPLGVVAGITPFNFPLMVPAWMYPLALATGNTFVLKPSPLHPTAPLHAAEMLTEAGLPDGGGNVVSGDKEAVDFLLSHDDVKAVSFVGSIPIADYIYETGARNGKRVQALGSAKNHLVVIPDADLDKAVDLFMVAAYGSPGERCMSISVAVLAGIIADVVVEKIKARIASLKVGNGLEDANELGPLISKQAHDRMNFFVYIGVSEGARRVAYGRSHHTSVPGTVYFVGATLFNHVTPIMRIYKEEIFGPVLSCLRADSLAEAIGLINRPEFGNGVSCYTQDGHSAHEFSRRIQVGMVGINVPIPVPMAWQGFGGWKRSLFGDLHASGTEGVKFHTKQKSIMKHGQVNVANGAEFSMSVSK